MGTIHKKILLFSLPIWLLSCQTFYQPQSVQYKDYRLTQTSKQDANINNALKPYSDSVNKSMNDIVAVNENELEKKQPEGTLGNVMADAMLAMSKKYFNQQVDAAFINYGGIRLPNRDDGPKNPPQISQRVLVQRSRFKVQSSRFCILL